MASAHEHHTENIPEGETVSADPMDTILWIHIFIQMLTFGIIFPIGMVLGIIKNRWHVPVQSLGSVLSLLGFFIGHMHKGRQFQHNVHASFSGPLSILLIAQVIFGLYLKLHLEKGVHARIRPVVRKLHGITGKAFPVLSWTQMIFGGITALGFCQGDHFGQCLAHFIMGSAFIAYGIVLTILLLVGQLWLRRTRRSQDFYDSAIIAAWGCINTFTEHRWGTAWVKNDWQHTTMGIIWWCTGLAGVWLSRSRDGAPRRNFIPGFVLFITGWAMSAHPQDLPVSAMTHRMFGFTLMAAGLTRIIEVSFIVKETGIADKGQEPHNFQYLPVFLLYASGFLFLGATEEQMLLVARSGLDHVSYVLILYSLASLLFLFVNMLIHLYDRGTFVITPTNKHISPRSRSRSTAAHNDPCLRDAEQYELDGLISEDEGEGRTAQAKLLRHDDDLSDIDPNLPSPSTIGKNSDQVAH